MPKTTEPAGECEFCGKTGGHEAGCPVSMSIEGGKIADSICAPGICVGCTFKPKCKKKWAV